MFLKTCATEEDFLQVRIPEPVRTFFMVWTEQRSFQERIYLGQL